MNLLFLSLKVLKKLQDICQLNHGSFMICAYLSEFVISSCVD